VLSSPRITRKSEKAVLVSTVSKLTSLCKQTMSDPKAEKLAQLMSYYDIDWDGPGRGAGYCLPASTRDVEEESQP
jgi:hypothetical protein